MRDDGKTKRERAREKKLRADFPRCDPLSLRGVNCIKTVGIDEKEKKHTESATTMRIRAPGSGYMGRSYIYSV